MPSDAGSKKSGTETGTPSTAFLFDFLESTMSTTCKQTQESHSDTCFELDQVQVPKITVSKYMARIMRYLDVPVDEQRNFWLCATIYVDRYTANANTRVGFQNVHLTLFTAALICHKYLYDFPFRMNYYAEVAGFPLEVLTSAEKTMLSGLAYSLFVTEADFSEYDTAVPKNGTTDLWIQKSGSPSRHHKKPNQNPALFKTEKKSAHTNHRRYSRCNATSKHKKQETQKSRFNKKKKNIKTPTDPQTRTLASAAAKKKH